MGCKKIQSEPVQGDTSRALDQVTQTLMPIVMMTDTTMNIDCFRKNAQNLCIYIYIYILNIYLFTSARQRHSVNKSDGSVATIVFTLNSTVGTNCDD